VTRAVVTGASGFLGRAVCAALRAAGWEVVGLDRLAADVADPGALLRHALPAALVVHLAAPTRPDERRGSPLRALQTAAAGTANAAALAEACGAAGFVLASSGKVFGRPRTLPIPDDHPTAPTTWLGDLKLLQESVTALAARRGGRFGATLLRIFNVYGPHQRADFIVPRLVQAWRGVAPVRLGELDHGRDYVHVADVARAFAAVAGAPPAPGAVRAWNVGTGRATTVRGLAAILTAASGHAPPIEQEPARLRPDEPPLEAADCAGLAALGWRPAVALEDGLRALWAT
jgi:nucleoside-diphosphate-sugar epimerase